ncbi:MAG TPA: lytic murein transglycosylase [Aldersonia sp.]
MPRSRHSRRSRALALLAVVAATTVSCSLIDPGPEVPEGIPPGPGTPLPAIDVDAPGRTAGLLNAWATPQADALGISVTALEAYGYAAAVLAGSRPDCGIAWTTLAGIGSLESKHGTYGGATVAPDGTAAPSIRGVPLDGGPGVAEIADSDGGQLDGDSVHDRAMGPMQFIPETWRRWGVDANGDGVAIADNIDDAALTAAVYLCARGGDLTTPEGWQNALMAYNLSGSYLREVRDRAAAYSVGQSA